MIKLKTQQQIESIKAGGKILSRILDALILAVKPGVSTGELDQLADRLISEAGGVPSFKGYKPDGFDKPFPGVICASRNNKIVHGIPSFEDILQAGDCISLDIGMIYEKCYTDMAKTVPVGPVSPAVAQLLEVTKTALDRAILMVVPGNTIYDIGAAIEDYVKPFGYGIVRDLVGHGVGSAIWEEPQIPNYRDSGTNKIIMRPGLVIAIEPMLNLGLARTKISNDGWTIVTSDGSVSAHFEHTVIVTENGHEIATI